MAKGSIFTNNRTQAVRLPAQMRFDDDIKQVSVRRVGKDRILCPLENTWDSFFMQERNGVKKKWGQNVRRYRQYI
ncbi:type II toxin-antitoxin system VapB family antitoxin [Marinicellulosiphila megalodicopiae]|uniref:type II toxin-antitoxin system VapB family antitoxin n=1 Tax=Marinicellulosiphila megalodicopiae TaxID=2724896 RepID=UPI003BAF0081